MRQILLFLIVFCCPRGVWGQLDFEQSPINYSAATPTDPVKQLADRLDEDRAELVWDERSGYLKSLLEVLKIPESSQTLVFSKTSLQVAQISPRTPRAIYFNDDVYVGWVQRGDVIEVSAADPNLGATFYTLDQTASANPVLKRETSRCLQCHGSTHTRRVPGHIVRSVYPDKTGLPVFRMGTHISSPSSSMADRFGGWYVTGKTGSLKHMGNAWIDDPDVSEKLQQTESFNVQQLDDFVDTRPYLSKHSDVIALMVLQHQAHVHNVLTAANHAGILTERDALTMNKALDRDLTFQSESTQRRYDSSAAKVLDALLSTGESRLGEQLVGTSSFQKDFESMGPFDGGGRSLRQIDGVRRLFRYPCSFLVYSEPFQRLHDEVRSRVIDRLSNVLSGIDDDPDGNFQHLSTNDRLVLREILQQTNAL